ncbi:MAG: helix-turn-helix domain-containing protein [Lacrimispora sphenoides]
MDTKFTDYKTPKETAAEWGVTLRMVHLYCAAGRIPDVIKLGRMWLIPRDAVKPSDGRKNNRRQPKKEGGQ